MISFRSVRDTTGIDPVAQLSSQKPTYWDHAIHFSGLGVSRQVDRGRQLIGDEGKRCAAYRLLFARRFPKRALSRRRRAVRERVTNRLAPIVTLALPSHKGSFVQHEFQRPDFGQFSVNAALLVSQSQKWDRRLGVRQWTTT